jgi:glycyl-tRNA synthetase
MSKKLETAFKTLCIEQQIISPSYTHYGGLAGFQDYGIIGLRIKQNLVSVWRTHWLTNNIDEVEVPDIAPYAVLKASGHVDKFSDQIVELNGTEIRADHLVKEIYNHLNLNEDTVDSMTTVELEKVINDNIQFVISKYSTNGSQEKESNKTKELKVRTKSLMLGIKDGSTYLMRPELAQTIYPNFRRYFDYHGKLPFGIAQVGRSYRNEICPRAFERLRSFTQAEVEYFYDPSLPIHPEWPSVSSLIV